VPPLVGVGQQLFDGDAQDLRVPSNDDGGHHAAAGVAVQPKPAHGTDACLHVRDRVDQARIQCHGRRGFDHL